MKYIVKYDNVVIGTYNIIDKENVEYKVDKEGIEILEKRGYNLLPILKESRTSKDIPFFSTMIKNCKRFGKIIKYHNNKLELEEIG